MSPDPGVVVDFEAWRDTAGLNVMIGEPDLMLTLQFSDSKPIILFHREITFDSPMEEIRYGEVIRLWLLDRYHVPGLARTRSSSAWAHTVWTEDFVQRVSYRYEVGDPIPKELRFSKAIQIKLLDRFVTLMSVRDEIAQVGLDVAVKQKIIRIDPEQPLC